MNNAVHFAIARIPFNMKRKPPPKFERGLCT